MSDEQPEGGQKSGGEQQPQAQPKARGERLKITQGHCLFMMDDILDKLKLLNYENKFCSQQLFSWLCTLNGQQVQDYASYDDPITVASNIQFELKKMGIQCDFPPLKLKAGAGEYLCLVLQKLVTKTLNATRFKFRKPHIKKEVQDKQEIAPDEPKEEGIQEDENILGGDSDDELSDGFDFQEEQIPDEDKYQRQVMYTKIPQKEWKIECEHAIPRLKIEPQRQGREWRNHLEKTKKYRQNINKFIPQAKQVIEKKSEELMKILEKIAHRERNINQNLSEKGKDYTEQAEELKNINNQYNTLSSQKHEKEDRLRKLTDKLEELQLKASQQGEDVSDSSPLVKIKAAYEKLQKEIQQMEVRIGVLRHSVTQHQYKAKRDKLRYGSNYENYYGDLQNMEDFSEDGMDEL